MTEIEVGKQELIAEIIDRTLDELASWEPPKLMPGVGPQYPEVHLEYERKIAAYRLKVGAMLAKKTTGELYSDFLQDIGSAFNPLSRSNGIYFEYFNDLDRLRKSRLPWFACGWSVQGHRVEVEYWMAADTISIEEATLLYVGVDPREIRYDAVFEYYSKDARLDEVLYFLEERYDLIVRRFGEPDEGPVKIDMSEFCLWAQQKGVKVSNELKAIIQKRKALEFEGSRKTDSKDQNRPLHARTKEMFQRVVFVAACQKYGLREKKDAAKVAKAMATDGDHLGFNLDPQKLARHIRAGFSLLDEGVEAEIRKRDAEK